VGAIAKNWYKAEEESMTLESLKTNVPKIDSVLEGFNRPFWSVMIPTYNCAKYLRKTLKSVLEQDLGLEKMQIEIVLTAQRKMILKQ
jgi:cellulose synthase/poly-beta-1,6-N-acetylglucosamine synthase-like glycosyltransferase